MNSHSYQPPMRSMKKNYLQSYSCNTGETILDSAPSILLATEIKLRFAIFSIHQKEFIHIKDGGSASKLSHLFNQGYVSASTFITSREYRNDFRTKLSTTPTIAAMVQEPINPNEYRIVFRILKTGRSLTLSFFNKVVLDQTYRKIKNMSFQFRLEWVPKR